VFTGFQYSALGTTGPQDGRPDASIPDVSGRWDKALVVSYFASQLRTELFRQSPVRWEAWPNVAELRRPRGHREVGSGQCDAMVEALKGFVAREYVAGVHIRGSSWSHSRPRSTVTPFRVLLDRSHGAVS